MCKLGTIIDVVSQWEATTHDSIHQSESDTSRHCSIAHQLRCLGRPPLTPPYITVAVGTFSFSLGLSGIALISPSQHCLTVLSHDCHPASSSDSVTLRHHTALSLNAVILHCLITLPYDTVRVQCLKYTVSFAIHLHLTLYLYCHNTLSHDTVFILFNYTLPSPLALHNTTIMFSIPHVDTQCPTAVY